MTGQSTAAELIPTVDDAHAQAIAPGKSVTVLDARPPVPWSAADEEASLVSLRVKAGQEAMAIESRVQEAARRVRAELNEAAGGQASDHVMVLAHNATVAQLAVELQQAVSLQAFGRYMRNEGDKGQTEKGLHRLVGICAFATDLQTKAREAAREEGKAAKGSATDQLFGRIGVGQSRPGVDVGVGASPPGSENTPAQPPVQGGGVSTFESPPPPVPGGSK